MSRRVKLSEIASFQTGPFGTQLKASEYSVTGTPVINVKNIGYGNLILNDLDYVPSTVCVRLSNHLLKEGDIVFGRKGSVDRHCYIKEENENWMQGSDCIRVRVKKGIDSRYLSYYLMLDRVKKQINNSSVGSTMASINTDILKRIEIILPEIEEQNLIATLLSKIDEKIENNNKINAELESMAKTIYDYWFLQFEFPNEEGKPYKSSGGKMVWNEELKREIPEKWESVQLGEIFSFVKGKIPEKLSDKQEKDLYPYITIDVANNAPSQFCNRKNMPYCNGEVIMVMDGAASGDVYIGNYGVLGSTFAMLKRKRGDVSDSLIYRIINCHSMIYKKANTGSTVPHANRKYIETMRIPLSKDMTKFSNTFDEIYKKIIQNRQENQELISLRDFLLPLLMNGQLGFKD